MGSVDRARTSLTTIVGSDPLVHDAHLEEDRPVDPLQRDVLYFLPDAIGVVLLQQSSSTLYFLFVVGGLHIVFMLQS